MLRLPSLAAGSAEWRLPLPDEAATLLLACLCAPSSRRRMECLAQALKGSPSFLVWVVCRDACHVAEPPETIGELANRFFPRLPGELDWPETGRAANRWLASSEKRWASLTERSLRVAELAASLAANSSSAGDASRRHFGQAYLLGLLHGAADWLSSCGPAVRVSRGPLRPSPLPAWLVHSLRAIHHEVEPSGASAVVGEAVRRFATRNEERAAPAAPPRVETSGAAAASRLAGGLLPHVVAKLRRLEQLESQFQATLEREKLESLRQLAYGASHEINNPLANISTRAQTLLREETNPERRRRLATINAQAFRAHEMISDMMLFAKPPELVLGPVDLPKLVETVVGELQPQAEQQGTALTSRLPVTAPALEGDRVQLTVALRSLCVNALEALGGGGAVEIHVGGFSPPLDSAREWVEIGVRDTGPGIAPEVRRHLFDPFYSGREAGRGLGLGLSKCWRIVTLHGGRIEVESRVGAGALFLLRLPCRHGAATGDK